MLRVVNKTETHVVQKVVHPRGDTLRYQTVPVGGATKDNPVLTFPTLGEANTAAGAVVKTAETPRKMRMKDYPENQRGFKRK
tara:strand:+ start:1702 stop:1947 length:246 start_codon:yes stop_codon:yes gene_type:complete